MGCRHSSMMVTHGSRQAPGCERTNKELRQKLKHGCGGIRTDHSGCSTFRPRLLYKRHLEQDFIRIRVSTPAACLIQHTRSTGKQKGEIVGRSNWRPNRFLHGGKLVWRSPVIRNSRWCCGMRMHPWIHTSSRAMSSKAIDGNAEDRLRRAGHSRDGKRSDFGMKLKALWRKHQLKNTSNYFPAQHS